MVLEEPGESDLLGKLKEHQLQEEDGDYLRQREEPILRRARSLPGTEFRWRDNPAVLRRRAGESTFEPDF